MIHLTPRSRRRAAATSSSAAALASCTAATSAAAAAAAAAAVLQRSCCASCGRPFVSGGAFGRVKIVRLTFESDGAGTSTCSTHRRV